MISKERLEELIEQKATVYWLQTHGVVTGIKLPCKEMNLKDDGFELLQDIHGNYCYYVKYDELTESMEDAEFYAKFTYIPRTEFLELPTFEDFSKWGKSVQFYRNGTRYSMYVFVKNKNTKNCRIIIYADNGEQDWFVFEQPLTQENYLKACRKCKELFLGGSDGDIR